MSVLTMRWRDTLFAHWPVAPEVVAERLPDALSLDTYDGRAWLGVVGFLMEDVGPRGVPFGLTFPELNLRTYVTRGGEPGVYFFNLDAGDRLSVAIARRFFRLPYYRAEMRFERRGRGVTLRSRRLHPGAYPLGFEATYGPTSGGVRDRERADFLTERYRFYTESDDGRLYAGDVEHDPWPLRRGQATFERNDCFAANDFDHPTGDPVLYYCPRLDVRAGRLRRA
ncbi:YqjF family protein [Halomarina pelagica]|uniref:YqjF family protein n=1 Tax=Halomarina pelagica TaxID=2961599 RepID=UPI0020C3E014|nr:DUF2071 domain-containing protein [Halomarina sp. BND7]